MLRKSSFVAKLFGGLIDKFVFCAFAEGEPAPSSPDPTEPEGNSPAPQVNFEQMVAQARKEEKDKLYPRIERLTEENKALTSSVNKYLLENATLKEEIEKLKARSEGNEELKELQAKVEELTAENEELKSKTVDEEAIRKQIEEEYEVKLYAQEQITANKDSIVSVLIPEVVGKTKEEIDEAIAKVKEKTIAIKKDLGIDVEDEGDEKKNQKEKGSKKKKVPVAVPTHEVGKTTYDAEYVRNLDPRSEEYKEFRKEMGLK